MAAEWSIQGRGHHCAATSREFVDGEFFYTLLYEERDGYRREDLSEEAYHARPADAPAPYSFWRAKYEAPPVNPEPIAKQSAEDLLRKYMEEEGPEHGNARYILALMLERKRMLKEREVKTEANGSLTRIYEHSKTGEVFVIPDPGLRLDQLEEVQAQLAEVLR